MTELTAEVEVTAGMKLLGKAVRIAASAHEHQVDKAGEAYILHPLRSTCSTY